MSKRKIPKEVEELAEDLSGGYWNSRIIKKHVDGKYKNGKKYHETYMAIFEVYYRKDNTIWAWSENPMNSIFEDKEGFGILINQMFDAAQRPVLEEVDGKLIETNEILIPEKMIKKGKKKDVKQTSN